MAIGSAIGWTADTINPWIGCTEIPGDPACEACYARDYTERGRLSHMGITWGPGRPRHKTKGLAAKFRASARLARQEKRVRRVFVDSLCDFADAEVDPAWPAEVFALAKETPEIIMIALTKRPNRLAKILPADWEDGYPNVLLGISASLRGHFVQRTRIVGRIPAWARVVSLEPLEDDFPEDLHRSLFGDPVLGGRGRRAGFTRPIDWVIAGGVSGPHFRALPPASRFRWVRDVCFAADVPFTFKQWGGRRPDSNGHRLDGREHLEIPPFMLDYARRTFGPDWGVV